MNQNVLSELVAKDNGVNVIIGDKILTTTKNDYIIFDGDNVEVWRKFKSAVTFIEMCNILGIEN